MRAKAALAVLSTALACAACHRETAAAPEVDHTAACTSSATLAKLQDALLRPDGAPGKRYLERVKTARITLSDVSLTDYDGAKQIAHCTATAHLAAPAMSEDTPVSEQVSYAAQQQADGSIRISELGGPPDVNIHQFAEALARKPKSAPPPVAAPAPPTEAAAGATGTATGSGVTLSDEARQLVDQAGDTRARSSDDAPQDNAVVNSISNSVS